LVVIDFIYIFTKINRNIDISNFFDTPFPSISKKLFTDKAKKLYKEYYGVEYKNREERR